MVRTLSWPKIACHTQSSTSIMKNGQKLNPQFGLFLSVTLSLIFGGVSSITAALKCFPRDSLSGPDNLPSLWRNPKAKEYSYGPYYRRRAKGCTDAQPTD